MTKKLEVRTEELDAQYDSIFGNVAEIIEAARRSAARSVNSIMTAAYWLIGRRVVEFEQSGKKRAEYGTALIERLAVDMSKRFGRGFSRQNIQQMRLFYLLYPVERIFQTVSAESSLAGIASRFPLPWSAYVRLLSVKNKNARAFYEAEALGGDFDRADRADIQSKVSDAEEAAKDEVWGGYRFVVIADSQEPDGLKTIDLGAGHSSGGETLCGRVITALKSQALLNESVGAGYIERNCPPALQESGAWPLASLRQSFLNGSLTRLLDPDTTLRGKIVEFVSKGDFGLASGQKPDGTYERVWFNEPLGADEVAFESGVFLLLKSKASLLKTMLEPGAEPEPTPGPEPTPVGGRGEPTPGPSPEPEPRPSAGTRTFRISGDVPPEIWNRLGTKVLPKLRGGSDLKIGIEFSVTIDGQLAQSFETDLKQILEDLGLTGRIHVE